MISKQYCINFKLNNKKKLNNEKNKYHIPEFDDIESKVIILVSPSQLYPKKHPRTVFFQPLFFPS